MASTQSCAPIMTQNAARRASVPMRCSAANRSRSAPPQSSAKAMANALGGPDPNTLSPLSSSAAVSHHKPCSQCLFQSLHISLVLICEACSFKLNMNMLASLGLVNTKTWRPTKLRSKRR